MPDPDSHVKFRGQLLGRDDTIFDVDLRLGDLEHMGFLMGVITLRTKDEGREDL